MIRRIRRASYLFRWGSAPGSWKFGSALSRLQFKSPIRLATSIVTLRARVLGSGDYCLETSSLYGVCQDPYVTD